MGSPRVDLVERCFDAYHRGADDELIDMYHSDAVVMPMTGARVEGGGYVGHSGLRAYLQEVHETWEEMHPRGETFTEMDDRVIVSGHCLVRGRGSGAEHDQACVWVFHIPDERIAAHRVCQTMEEALEWSGRDHHAG